jgi:hypothetical protein
MASATVRPYPPTSRTTETRTRFHLTEREQAKYSICRAILNHCDRLDGVHVNSLELEISDTIGRQSVPKRQGSLFIPLNLRVDPQASRRAAKRARAGVSTALATGTPDWGRKSSSRSPGLS